MKTTLLIPFALLAACGDDGTTTPDACDPTIPNTICTIAGSGKNGYDGDGGPALAARMSLPQDTLLGPDGTLYILDWNNHRIRSLPGDGTIQHVAGRGELGGTLDDPANDDFNHPTGILLDASGTKMTVAAWHNSKLRDIDLATGAIKDSCGDGRRAYFGDGGPALTAALDLPASITRSPGGDLIVMDQANQVIRKIDATGTITRLAGKCVIDAPPPTGGGACAVGVDPVACPGGSGKFTCGGMATCGAPCTPGYSGDEGPAMELRMGQPFGQSADPAGRIAYDRAGNLFFADTGNHVIRKIDTAGVVHRIAGTPQTAGYAGDGGPALSAQLSNPVDLAFGPDGTLYFTDVYNHCVRGIAPDQTIKTVAGICGQSGYDGDGADPLAAHLKRPYGLEVDNGVLYISDTGNAVIRSIVLPLTTMRWMYLLVLVGACTDDPAPVFPADYAATYTEVRDCRSSSDHDLHRIRVLAAPDALGPYMTRTSAFPVDSIVLKAEYDFGDTSCTGPVIEWTVMQKLGTPEDLGWIWQRVAADRSVTTQNDSLCITCHTSCGVAPDGYDGTCTMP